MLKPLDIPELRATYDSVAETYRPEDKRAKEALPDAWSHIMLREFALALRQDIDPTAGEKQLRMVYETLISNHLLPDAIPIARGGDFEFDLIENRARSKRDAIPEGAGLDNGSYLGWQNEAEAMQIEQIQAGEAA